MATQTLRRQSMPRFMVLPYAVTLGEEGGKEKGWYGGREEEENTIVCRNAETSETMLADAAAVSRRDAAVQNTKCTVALRWSAR